VTRWFKDSNKILLAWGAMDAFHLTRYSLKAWQAGNIPYLTDLMNTLALSSELGLPSLMMAAASWGLQFSIILTAILFLCGYRPARYLGLAQIPFRLSVHLPVDNANPDGGKLLGTKSTPFGSAATGIRGPERLDALETCLIREKLPMLMPAAVTGSPVWGIVPIEVMLFTTRR